MRCERGQAAIEWVGLVLLASIVLGALVTALPSGEGRSFGAALSGRILCAMQDAGCTAGAPQPAGADGQETRAFSPTGPADAEPTDPARLRRLVESIPGLTPPDYRQTPSVPCDEWWCDVVIQQCEVVFKEPVGEAFCKARASAEANKPNPLTQFIKDRAGGCLVGAVGGKAFEAMADELLKRATTRSPKDALRALKRGLERVKGQVGKGKVKPGVIGCIGGALGL